MDRARIVRCNESSAQIVDAASRQNVAVNYAR